MKNEQFALGEPVDFNPFEQNDSSEEQYQLGEPVDFNPFSNEPPKEKGNAFSRGFKTGKDQLQALGGGVVALGSDLVGYEKGKEYGLEVYQRNMEEAGENALEYGFTDINSADRALEWTGYTLGNLIPTMATSLAGGGAGGFAVKSLSKKAVEKYIKEQVKKGVKKEVAEKAIGSMLAKRIAAGQGIGAFTASAGMESGSIYGETEDAGVSLTHGLVAGGLDALPVMRILDKFGLGKQAKAELQQSIIKEGLKQGVFEAGTEAAQTFIEQHAQYWVENNGESLLNNLGEANYKEIIDAAAAGFLGGNVFGGGSQALNNIGKPKTAPASKAAENPQSPEQNPAQVPGQQDEGIVPSEYDAPPIAPTPYSPPDFQHAAQDIIQPQTANEAEEDIQGQISRLERIVQEDLAYEERDIQQQIMDEVQFEIDRANAANIDLNALSSNNVELRAGRLQTTAPPANTALKDRLTSAFDQRNQEIEAVETEKFIQQEAKKKKARSLYEARNQINPEKDDFLTAVAKAGGLSRKEAEAQGIDPADFNKRGGGIRRVFTQQGATFDQMAERLAQEGYISENYTANEVLDKISRALKGEKILTKTGVERQAEIDYYDTLDINQIDASEPERSLGQLATDAVRKGVPVSTIEEIFDWHEGNEEAIRYSLEAEIQNPTQDNTDERQNESALASSPQADEGEFESRGETIPDDFSETEVDELFSGKSVSEIIAARQPLLETQTEEDLRAKADKETQRKKAESEKESKAKADDEREDFVLSGSNREADKAAARGQNSLFDQPVGKPQAESDNARETTWQTFEDQDVQRINDEPFVAVPATGSRSSLKYHIIDIRDRSDIVTQLNKKEVHPWLFKNGIEDKPSSKETAKRIVGDKFEVSTKLMNEVGEAVGFEETYIGKGENAKHIAQVIADENLKQASEDKIQKAIEKHQRGDENAQQKRLDRAGKGRTNGAGAGGFNRDIDRIETNIHIAKSEIDRLEAELKRRNPGQPTTPKSLFDDQANEAATSPTNDLPEPTEAQTEAGNYKKGHVNVQGLDITIENPKGSIRSGTDPDGNKWEVEMKSHYGYIKKTEGADGEHVDVFIGPDVESEQVFIVDQVNKDGSFDEHKVLLGFKSMLAAKAGYKSNYQKRWKVGPTKAMSMDEFKAWLKDGDNTKPFDTTDVRSKNQKDIYNRAPFKTEDPIAARQIIDQAESAGFEWRENSQGKFAWFDSSGTQKTGAYDNKDWKKYSAEANSAILSPIRTEKPEVTIESHPEFERLNKLYGKLSNSQLETEIEKMSRKIADLQHSAKREFTGNNTRRYGPAMSAQGAREIGDEKLLASAYKQWRESSKNNKKTNVESSAKEKSKLAKKIEAQNIEKQKEDIKGVLNNFKKKTAKEALDANSIKDDKVLFEKDGEYYSTSKEEYFDAIESLGWKKTELPAQETPSLANNQQSEKPEKSKLAQKIEAKKEGELFLPKLNKITEKIDEGITLDEFKQGFKELVDNKDVILAEFSNMTKRDLLGEMYQFNAYRAKGEKKEYAVEHLFTQIIDDFTDALSDGNGELVSLGSRLSYIDSRIQSATKKVEAATQEKLDDHAKKMADKKAESEANIAKREEGIDNPQSLEDYQNLHRKIISDNEGITVLDARMKMKPEQRIEYDRLAATMTREKRKSEKTERKTSVGYGSQTTESEIIETKHTKKGHDLFVVQLAERLEKEDYNQMNASAKRLGGYYSSYRGNGATPGFQFRTREDAEAFSKLAKGDTADAEKIAKEKRSAFEDDKSQSTLERLRTMAEALKTRSEEEINRDRKTNTSRRASMAAGIIARAESDKAFAETLSKIADGVEKGDIKFLDGIRAKTQLDQALSDLKAGNHDLIREQYPNYADYEKHRYDPPTYESVDKAEWPNYSAYRSDLARLSRQLLETDGLKRLGKDLAKIANDTSAAYKKWAKENLHKVAVFTTKDGGMPGFATTKAAELSIEHSGFNGQAIPLQVKRGENTIILSSSEAMRRGLWEGDDKKIYLQPTFGQEIVEKAFKKNRRLEKDKRVDVPWQFAATLDERKRYAAMGIESPAEFRAMLRELVDVLVPPKQMDKVRELELKMVGRKKDGLDFFPTSPAVVDQMLEAAEIEEGMTVLEPSAGMGHIADQIRNNDIEPDVIEFSSDRRELLEAKGFNIIGNDFLEFKGEYDRILMNPPFSKRQDMQHILHAFNNLKVGGRIVAISGEGVMFGQDKKATAFREWLDEIGATTEKLPEGSFQDPSLPVNTGVNARMIVIDKAESNKNSADSLLSDHFGTNKADEEIFSKTSEGATPVGMSVKGAKLVADSFLRQYKGAANDGIKVRIVRTQHELLDGKYSSRRFGRIKGVYRPGENTVYLVSSNLDGATDARHTLQHEILVHKGLGFLPLEARQKLINTIAENAPQSPSLRKQWQYIERNYKNDTDYRKAEELMAHLAHRNLSIYDRYFNKIIQAFKDIFVNLGWMKPGITKQKLIEEIYRYAEAFRQGKTAGLRAPMEARMSKQAIGSELAEDDAFFSRQEDDNSELYDKLGLNKRHSRTLAKKVEEFKNKNWKQAIDNAKKRAYEGGFDGLIGIKRAEDEVGAGIKANQYDKSGYVGARLATGIADVMTGILHFGAVEWRDGVPQGKADTEGLIPVLSKLGSNLDDWLAWMAGNRGQELMDQGRENNLTPEDIDELKTKNKGNEDLFEEVRQQYLTINSAMLDFAEGAGLIDPKSRQEWESEWYVPFYRMGDTDSDSQLLGPRTKRGLSHQSAGIKALRGGEVATNDLLENILTNWIKLADSSLKNSALLKTVDNLKDSRFISDETLKYQQVIAPKSEIVKRIKADRNYLEMVAEHMGIPESGELELLHEIAELDSKGFEKLWSIVAPTDPDVIRIQRDGKNEYYKVHDEALMRAVTHLGDTGNNDPFTRTGRWFKRLLTTGVTASPDFIVRNFIRDAAHAWAINPDGFKFGIDSVRGLVNAIKEDPDYQAMMFGGASFQGGYVHGTDPERSSQIVRRALEAKGLTSKQIDVHLGSIVDTTEKGAALLSTVWQKYRAAGDKVENSNRLSTFKAALAKGKPMAQALYESKDLMDYSMRGNHFVVTTLTDVVPFLNARLQGLSKLVRASKDNKRLVAMNIGKIAAASLLLAWINEDDEDYQGLPDWEKDAYWHVFSDGRHYRIPKPFEIGIIGATIPERMWNVWVAETQPSEKLLWSIKHNLMDTMNFQPIPQAVLPLAEVVANRSFYFDTPIEGMADEGKLPEARYNEYTSETMKKLGEWLGMSPKKLEHIFEGYTGTMGAYSLSATDILTRKAVGADEPPAYGPEDYPLVKSFYRGKDRERSSQWQTDFYDRMNEVSELHRTFNAYQKEGRVIDAKELFTENKDKLKHKKFLDSVNKEMRNIRQAKGAVLRSGASPEEKKKRINELNRRINEITRAASLRTEADF